LFQGGFEVFDDFLGDNVRLGEIVGLFQAFVSEPENIQAGFVAVDELFIGVSAPALAGILLRPSRRPLMTVLGIVALDELVEVFALQRVSLESEVFLGSKIVDPEPISSRAFRRQ
jgi:hypothetical protein